MKQFSQVVDIKTRGTAAASAVCSPRCLTSSWSRHLKKLKPASLISNPFLEMIWLCPILLMLPTTQLSTQLSMLLARCANWEKCAQQKRKAKKPAHCRRGTFATEPRVFVSLSGTSRLKQLKRIYSCRMKNVRVKNTMSDIYLQTIKGHSTIQPVTDVKWWCFRPLLCTLLRLNWAKQTPGIMRRQ